MQTIFVFIVVGSAVIYIGYQAYKRFFGKQKPGCDKCQ